MNDPKNMKDLIARHGAKKVSELILDILGPGITEALNQMGFDSEAMIRYMPLSDEMKRIRASKNMGLKEAATALKSPQYKIKAIEDGSLKQIEPPIFHKYIAFLGMEPQVGDWCRENSELATRLKIYDAALDIKTPPTESPQKKGKKRG